ncbi:MAG: hypothetical protein PHD88_07055 [Firmicutes bacterium]|nr:hypothetical protein [Bacillota bacterium]MDD4694140.1 hypothetical protein [Bacillota bacterium]
MKNEQIQGIGSIESGEYESINIEGIAKLKGDAKAGNVLVEGMFKSKGRIETKDLNIQGVHRAFGDIKAKDVMIEGVLKLRRASLLADKINCRGIITCTDEISTDELQIEGICSLKRVVGDKINIHYHQGAKDQLKMPSNMSALIKSYFGRKIDPSKCLVDEVECTYLTAANTVFKTIRAQEVILKDHCIVDELYSDGDVQIDKTCVVKKTIRAGKIVQVKEDDQMANPTLVKVLDLYKENRISVDEAEKMLSAIGSIKESISHGISLPWDDDKNLRIVAFLGHNLLEKSAPECQNIEVVYTGDVNHIESYGSITCGDIRGHATAGSSITCGDVGGNITAGSSVHSKDVGGKITAGGGVHIEK